MSQFRKKSRQHWKPGFFPFTWHTEQNEKLWTMSILDIFKFNKYLVEIEKKEIIKSSLISEGIFTLVPYSKKFAK